MLICIITPYIYEQIFTENLTIKDRGKIITPVAASSSFSSFRPTTFYSGSGKLHLLFHHEVSSDVSPSTAIYHMYEHENGSWSRPKRILGMWEIILVIIPTEEGFIIYLAPGEFLDGCCLPTDYIQIFDEYGIRKYEYNEISDTWSEPLEFWGENQIRDYLELPTQKIHCYLHSFYIKEDNSFFAVWSFDSYGSDENLSHEYKNRYIFNDVNSDFSHSNSIISQEVPYQNNQFMQLVPFNNSYLLYASGYTKRSMLNKNGSLTDWQELNNINYTQPSIPFNGIYFKREWDHSIITVANRYLFFDDGKRERILIDLTQENLTETVISFLYDISPLLNYREIEFEINNSSSLEKIFVTALITDEAIELWQFNYTSKNLTLVSSLNETIPEHSKYHPSGQMKIDLISDGEKWRIFWSQRVEVSLYEIFSVSFDTETQQWSSVTQLTFTDDINDDFNPNPMVDPISMVFLYLSGVIIIFAIFALVGYLLIRNPSN